MDTTDKRSAIANHLTDLVRDARKLADEAEAQHDAMAAASLSLAVAYLQDAIYSLRGQPARRRAGVRALYARDCEALIKALRKLPDDDAQARLLCEMSQLFEGMSAATLGLLARFAEAHRLYDREHAPVPIADDEQGAA